MGKIVIDNDLQSLIPSCRSCKSCPKTLLFDLKFQVSCQETGSGDG